ncbi:PREDICTED: microsomal glutathione S-transferase 1-like [Rhagoletis zephyria]|uniref:microsomal glutathione S-transferase 1-like n=1 Tax=Rhagoletis zephyria TaxID=28612 RepID=UPI0008114C4E|nr:PREDICTED: microsomal glutathione S-transferase 1-like [Rhagoletis zephyria]
MFLQTFINPEDILDKRIKVKYDDPDVERCRRAHRNDLESILPFFVIGLLYVLINPSPKLAINLFRAVGIARIIHTIVYAVVVVPQPSRLLAFLVGALVTTYMAFQVALTVL